MSTQPKDKDPLITFVEQFAALLAPGVAVLTEYFRMISLMPGLLKKSKHGN